MGKHRSIDPYCVNGDISLPKGIVYVMNSTLPEDAERQLLSG